ncbi:MAG: phosphoglycerate kinase [Planctomycetota bacterium]|nr:MAG: phosphoglycerate kinase [Planctomycetota bacterium]
MSLRKLNLQDLAFAGKRAFVRVDFNVPLKEGVIQDDTRIQAALPTLKFILEAGGAVIAASHLGRPKGQVVDSLRMAPVAERLQQSLPQFTVLQAGDVAGEEAAEAAAKLQPGQLLLLENLRFEAGETKNDPALAQRLASMADIFVQDAFGTCHRAHASTAGVPAILKPAVSGFLLEREIDAFRSALDQPKRPVVGITGGAKVSDKIPVLKNLIEKVDTILVGGGMAYTFLQVQGLSTGNSLVETERLQDAKEILALAEAAGVRFLLPSDHVIADRFAEDAASQTVEGNIPDGWMGLDIGPKTLATYQAAIAEAGTVIWNGPMGVFEMEAFRQGSLGVAQALAASDCVSVVGGGDSVSAIKMSGLADQVSHISTGGGAFLEMLEGKELPGIAALDDYRVVQA